MVCASPTVPKKKDGYYLGTIAIHFVNCDAVQDVENRISNAIDFLKRQGHFLNVPLSQRPPPWIQNETTGMSLHEVIKDVKICGIDAMYLDDVPINTELEHWAARFILMTNVCIV